VCVYKYLKIKGKYFYAGCLAHTGQVTVTQADATRPTHFMHAVGRLPTGSQPSCQLTVCLAESIAGIAFRKAGKAPALTLHAIGIDSGFNARQQALLRGIAMSHIEARAQTISLSEPIPGRVWQKAKRIYKGEADF
jgi:hypothetical protein